MQIKCNVRRSQKCTRFGRPTIDIAYMSTSHILNFFKEQSIWEVLGALTFEMGYLTMF
jgi:hypothetical protein